MNHRGCWGPPLHSRNLVSVAILKMGSRCISIVWRPPLDPCSARLDGVDSVDAQGVCVPEATVRYDGLLLAHLRGVLTRGRLVVVVVVVAACLAE